MEQKNNNKNSVYSTHEHTTSTTTTLQTPPPPLPLDITLELLASILILSAGIVFSSPDLRPIRWAQWAGRLQREGRKSEGRRTKEGEEVLSEGDPFAFLGLDGGIGGGSGKGAGGGEGRRGFWDVRAKRREYAEWVKAGGK